MDYLMLVDKFNPIDMGFYDRVELTEVNGKFMESQAGNRLRLLLKKAEADGIKLKIISAYRSFEYQQMLWEREVSHEMWGGLSYEKAVEKVGRTLALPGSSEHKTPESRWLCANAADFGFILRYPRLKEQMTGIDFEPWHYRYVGVEAARIIAAGGLCLEEFLHFYSEKYI